MGEYVIDEDPGYRIYLAKYGQQRDIDKAETLLFGRLSTRQVD